MKQLFAILLILSLALTACINLGPSAGKNEISVTGDAEKQVQPDQAELYLGVQTNDSSAQLAQDRNSLISNAVIDALKGAGISSDNIETMNYNLYPMQVYNPKTGESLQQGYQVTNTIKVTTNDFEKVGTLLSAAVNAGANEVQSVQFTLTKSKENEIKAQVLSEATSAAKSKAEAIAQGLGASLGSIKTVQESNVYFTPYIYGRAIGVAEAKTGSVPPINPQKSTVTASITVVYEIR